MPLTKVYEAVKSGVVRVLALDPQRQNIVSSGSGSVIGNGSLVLTCAHCVVPGAQMAIAHPTHRGISIHGNVAFYDPTYDIALLNFHEVVGVPVKLVDSANCAIGNGAFVVGYPMQFEEQVLLSAHIASISQDSIRIDASVNHGNSGGPLFNLAGEQIGVVNAKHGSLSRFLEDFERADAGSAIRVAGVQPIQALQQLIAEMSMNLNLGIGYAVPTAILPSLHDFFHSLIHGGDNKAQ